MKELLFIVCLSLIFGCEKPSNLPERVFLTSPDENPTYFEIRYDSLLPLDENGYPKESVNYIPLDLVQGLSLRYVEYLPPYETSYFENVPWYKIKYYKEVIADTFLVEYLSTLLYEQQEPILYDHYLGQESYRFIWAVSFHDDVVIRITDETNYCRLIAYQISADDPHVVVNKIEKKLSKREFHEFQNLIVTTNYWAHEPYSGTIGDDGSRWTIEAHTKSNYGLLTRWSPGLVKEDEFTLRLLGQWLIQKAELDHLQIY